MSRKKDDGGTSPEQPKNTNTSSTTDRRNAIVEMLMGMSATFVAFGTRRGLCIEDAEEVASEAILYTADADDVAPDDKKRLVQRNYQNTRRKAIDKNRKNQSKTGKNTDNFAEGTDANVESKSSSPDVIVENREVTEMVRLAIDKLDKELQDVLRLRYFELLTINEMAEVLGCSRATVLRRRLEALEQLRVILASVGGVL